MYREHSRVPCFSEALRQAEAERAALQNVLDISRNGGLNNDGRDAEVCCALILTYTHEWYFIRSFSYAIRCRHQRIEAIRTFAIVFYFCPLEVQKMKEEQQALARDNLRLKKQIEVNATSIEIGFENAIS